MIVFGSELDNNNISESGHNEGTTYDPGTDSWTLLPSQQLSPQATSIAWTGTRAVAWDYELEAAAYDPVASSWETIPSLPLHFSECYPSSAASGHSVFAWFCGQAALFDDRTTSWAEINPEDNRLRELSDVVGPVAADSVFLLPGIRNEDEGALWAYKPSVNSGKTSSGSSAQPPKNP
jgi:hypothetical protein